jgi:type IV pilus assembly protein PilB
MAAGLIDEIQLRSALGHQKRWGGKLGKALVDQGFIDEDTMLKFLSVQFKMKAVNLLRSRIAPQTFEMVPEDIARKYEVVPVVVTGTGSKKTIVLAMSDPSDLRAIDEIQFTTGAKVEPVLATDSAISKVLKNYGHFSPEMAKEYAHEDYATPLQLKERRASEEKAQPTPEMKKPKPGPSSAPGLEPDEGIDPGSDEDIEMVKGEVFMLKTKKPTRPTKAPEPRKRRPPPPAAHPEAPERGAEADDDEGSLFLFRPGEKADAEDKGGERGFPERGAAGPPPPIEEPPEILEGLQPIAEDSESPQPEPEPAEEGPVLEAPSITDEKKPSPFFVAPTTGDDLIGEDEQPGTKEPAAPADGEQMRERAPAPPEPIELPDEEPGDLIMAEAHEFISPTHHQEPLPEAEKEKLELEDSHEIIPPRDKEPEEEVESEKLELADAHEFIPPAPPQEPPEPPAPAFDRPAAPGPAESPWDAPEPPVPDVPEPPTQESAGPPEPEPAQAPSPESVQPPDREAPEPPPPPAPGIATLADDFLTPIKQEKGPGLSKPDDLEYKDEDASQPGLPPPPVEAPPLFDDEESAPGEDAGTEEEHPPSAFEKTIAHEPVPEPAPEPAGADAEEDASSVWGSSEGPPPSDDDDIWGAPAHSDQPGAEPEVPDLPPPPEPDAPADSALPPIEDEEKPPEADHGGPGIEESVDDYFKPAEEQTSQEDAPEHRIADLPFEAPPPEIGEERETEEAPEIEEAPEAKAEPVPETPVFQPFEEEMGEDTDDEFSRIFKPGALSDPGLETSLPAEEAPAESLPSPEAEETGEPEGVPDHDLPPPAWEPAPPEPASIPEDEVPSEDVPPPAAPEDEAGREAEPPAEEPSQEEEPEPLEEMKQVAVVTDESPGLEELYEEIGKLGELGDDFLDTREVKKRLSRVSDLERDLKDREYQLNELLSLMMKKELGEITQEMFMNELQVLKKLADESRKKKDEE